VDWHIKSRVAQWLRLCTTGTCFVAAMHLAHCWSSSQAAVDLLFVVVATNPQRQALKRMQEREQCRSGVTRPHPYIRPYPTSCPGLTLYVNQVGICT
jgi:hypothetical protein